MIDISQHYTKYLLIEPKKTSCVRLWEFMNIERKQINRFLEEEKNPKELFDEIAEYIDLSWWQLGVDDSVLDKEFSVIGKSDLVGKFRSWRHKSIVIWINLITLLYVDKLWRRFPVNFRVVDKKEWKTKNDYFIEMTEEVLFWWLKPSIVSWDSRYSWEKNLKFITKQWMWFVFSLKGNRKVKVKNSKEYQSVSELQIPKEWLVAHLRNIWTVKLFEHQWFIHAYRPTNQKKKRSWEQSWKVKREEFDTTHRNHWTIEEYHRVLKQVCNVDKHFFRNRNCIISHIFFSIRAFCVLEVSILQKKLKNRYSLMTTHIKQYMKQLLKNVSINWLIIEN